LVLALERITFTVEQGEILGICGTQSSGKTTLIRLLAALLIPDQGTIRVFGYDTAVYAAAAQQLTNPVSVDASFFRRLSAVENLVYTNRSITSEPGFFRERAIELLTRLGMDPSEMDLPMGLLSRTAQQKVTLTQALMACPPLLLLDDPMAGLDNQARQSLAELLKELRTALGTTIIFTTRSHKETSDLCDRVAILKQGKLLVIESPLALESRMVGSDIHLANGELSRQAANITA
jgi:ABC-2 type transport system ATP-binding protein